jgi:hypothetical protein
MMRNLDKEKQTIRNWH